MIIPIQNLLGHPVLNWKVGITTKAKTECMEWIAYAKKRRDDVIIILVLRHALTTCDKCS